MLSLSGVSLHNPKGPENLACNPLMLQFQHVDKNANLLFHMTLCHSQVLLLHNANGSVIGQIWSVLTTKRNFLVFKLHCIC
jgi:hypothetical protein